MYLKLCFAAHCHPVACKRTSHCLHPFQMVSQHADKVKKQLSSCTIGLYRGIYLFLLLMPSRIEWRRIAVEVSLQKGVS